MTVQFTESPAKCTVARTFGSTTWECASDTHTDEPTRHYFVAVK